jgi:hypothetical protein
MDMDKFKARMEKYDNGTTVPNLATQIHGMLPTPNAFDWNTPRSPEAWKNAKEKHGSTLQNPLKQMASVGMLPTPTAVDAKGAYRPESMISKNGKFDRTERLSNIYLKTGMEYNSKTSQLSPLFVEEMMGFPKNWTASPFQSGEKNPSKPTETP